ncbi:MAG TPA: DEAD/DEAH box helicase [Bacteroidia bacterium]|jgi:ATP-dependent RNA helicase DeaD|nr:DEAD/DEAH box helicase [Bacteroidia bacterium]
MTTFSELGLKPELAAAVAELGFVQPTPIQEQCIPPLLENNRDLVGLARTGTGKTAAFGLPLLQYVDPQKKLPQVLVLCPTRELCVQITGDLKSYAKKLNGIYIVPVYGGASISMQIKDLRRGAQVIVGTPGRLNDMIERGALKLGEIEIVVLDEADEMLNMGFREAIDTILAETPETKSTWLFSATMPDGVARIARSYMKDPISVSVKGAQETDGKIDHFYCMVHARDRYPALRRVIDAHPDIYGIVFCRTKAETQDVADHLVRDGYSADSLHGDLSQMQRDHVMKRFRSKTLQILVATDVAARGIDVDDITHVMHYQAPDEPEAYTHRSGRTGRAGKNGISILFVNAREQGRLREIERRTNRKLVYLPVPAGADVLKNQLFSFAKRLKESSNRPVDPQYIGILKEALGEMSHDEMLEKFMGLSLNKLLAVYANAPDLNVNGKNPTRDRNERSERSEGRGERSERPERGERREIEGEKHTFFFSIGRMDGVDPGALLRMCCDQMNIGRDHIGRIDLKHNFCFIQTIGVPQQQVMDSFKNFSFQGREVRVNEAENAGEGRRSDDGNRKPDFSESRSFERRDSGERKSYGEKRSFGERKEYGDRKPFGERKSFGDRKPFGERRSYSDRPERSDSGFGKKKSYGSDRSFGKKSYSDSRSENPGKGFGSSQPDKAHGADDWKGLMGGEGTTDRKKKFGKKK